MTEVNLLEITGKDFMEKYLSRENIGILLKRMTKEIPAEKHDEYCLKVATKLGMSAEEIRKQLLCEIRESASWAGPLESFEAGSMDIDDLMKKIYPERPFFMKPWLQPGSLVEIYGPTGIGKSFLRDSIALALTHGTDIGPWTVERPAGVFIVDGEMPAQSIRDRLEKLSYGLPQRQEPFGLVSSSDLVWNGYKAPNLAEAKWRDALSRYLEKHPEYQTLILDNVVSLFPGIDENTARDWSDSNQWMLRLRANNLAVIKIHHSTKEGKSARGTALQGDNMDAIIQLKRPNNYNPRQGAKFAVNFEKGRNLSASMADSFIFQIIPDPLNSDKLAWTTKSIEKQDFDDGQTNEKTKAIVTLLDEGKMKTQKDIAEAVGCKPQYVSTIKKWAIGEGLLDKDCKLTEAGKLKYGDIGEAE